MSGHLKSTSSADDRKIILIAEDDSTRTAAQIQQELRTANACIAARPQTDCIQSGYRARGTRCRTQKVRLWFAKKKKTYQKGRFIKGDKDQDGKANVW